MSACATGVAVLLIGGCTMVDGLGGGRSTEGGTSAEVVADPWSLPLEERPPLYDSCTELPEEALARIGFSPEDRLPEPEENEPGQLTGCMWKNQNYILTITGTWSSIRDFRYDNSFKNHERLTIGARDGMAMFRTSGFEACSIVFPTIRGIILVIGLRGGVDPIEENLSARAECREVTSKLQSMERYFPEGVKW